VHVGGNSSGDITTWINPRLDAAAVPLGIAAKSPQPVFAAVDIEAFTGRAWLLDKVDAFVAAQRCGYIWVDAEAGLGKTAFAAWLVHQRGYVSHFARYTQGEQVRVALANLAAQLIIRYGLDDLAPGRMLPSWAQSPDGFETLLQHAAACARRAGDRLVIVADGLDEAQTPPGALPWGLPKLLPDAVFVVATYRSGSTPERCEAPSTTVRIDRHSRDNREDVHRYLSATLARETVLAARLAQAGVGAERFAADLAERCGGVWVYVRYVLGELRVGSRRADDISTLPDDLQDYYADQILRWCREEDWSDTGLPIVSTLAAVGEPLDLDALAAFTGIGEHRRLRRWCDLNLRPFLDLTATTPRRYELYHASARAFLHGRLPTTADGDYREHARRIAEDLAPATTAAHARVADYYLDQFGSLPDLPRLATQFGLAQQHSGYPLRHLTRHLQQAGRLHHLRQLLIAEAQRPGHGAFNVWYAAHDHADTLDSYLHDLARARSIAAHAVDHAMATRPTAPDVAFEVFYALMAASITNLTDNIGTELLEQLLTTGYWTPQRGLAHARCFTDPLRRCDAFLRIRHTLPEEEQRAALGEALAAARTVSHEPSRAQALSALASDLTPPLLCEALAAARAIGDEDSRALALSGLAAYLPREEQRAVWGEALAAARAIGDEDSRALALSGLAAYLPREEQRAALGEALAAARAIGDEDSRAQALSDLASHLPQDLLGEALAAARAIDSRSCRARVLSALASHPPHEFLGEALAVARTIGNESPRAWALSDLASCLPREERPVVLGEALAAARSVNDEDSRVWLLSALASRLPQEERRVVLGEALAAARTISNESPRVWVLSALAPHPPQELLGEALAAARAIDSKTSRARVLSALAPHLPQELLGEALAVARTISDEGPRARVLSALASHLPRELLGEALAAAQAISDEPSRAWALRRLASHLPQEEQRAVLGHALAAARTIDNRTSRARVLSALASCLPQEFQAEALTAARAISDDYSQVWALSDLASHLPPEEQRAVWGEALAAARTINSRSSRARVLSGLAAYLPREEQRAVWGEALAAARTISDEDSQAQTLSALASRVPTELLSKALTAARTISDEGPRAQALSGLAAYLPREEQRAVWREALAAARAINDEESRVRVLSALASYLPRQEQPAVWREALAAARAINNEGPRAWVLSALASYLPQELLSDALTAARTISDEGPRAQALSGLAAHLPQEEQREVWGEALTAARAIDDEPSRERVLSELASCLPQDFMGEALAAARTISNEGTRAWVLSALAPHLPHEFLLEALAAAGTISDEDSRARVLSELASCLPQEFMDEALAVARRIDSKSSRARVLSTLAAHLPPEEQRAVWGEALAAAQAINDEYSRAQALRRLASHLPHELLGEALAATSDDDAVSALLARAEGVCRTPNDRLLLLRVALHRTNRRAVLLAVERTAAWVQEIGGERALQRSMEAIRSVYTWWP
jgi:hypothetical protein